MYLSSRVPHPIFHTLLLLLMLLLLMMLLLLLAAKGSPMITSPTRVAPRGGVRTTMPEGRSFLVARDTLRQRLFALDQPALADRSTLERVLGWPTADRVRCEVLQPSHLALVVPH